MSQCAFNYLSELALFAGGSVEECPSRCQAEQDCNFFAFNAAAKHNRRCELLRKRTGQIVDLNAISGPKECK